jgi:PD-(D/E)XK nuclease superfamily protein
MGLLKNRRNSRHQGDAGLGTAIGWFTQHGYRVAIPLTDSQDYDLIVDDGKKLYKVQVRTTYHLRYENIYQVNLVVSGGNRSGTGKTKYFDPEKVDLLFVLTDSGDQYLIPCDEITVRKSINLGVNYAQYKVN